MTSDILRIDGASAIGPDGRPRAIWLQLKNGRISKISGTPLPPQAGEAVLDASGDIVAAGLINAHTHSPLTATRGTTDRMDHPTFMWANQADTMGWSAEETEAVTTLAAADMARHGITGVVDHVPEQNADLETVAPIVSAWRASGMRVAVALRIFDGSYDDIGDGGYSDADNPLKPKPASVLLAMAEEAVRRWHDPASGVKIYIGPSNSERCSDDLLVGAHALAERYDTGFHAHLLETKVQRTSRLEKSGETPVARLERLGALSHRGSFAHCVWLDEADIGLMAKRQAVAVHNPHSNAKLGVGLMPLPKMLAAGCRVALGTDGASTNDTLDLNEVMACALLMQRVSGALPRDQWPGAHDALQMARTGGAAALLEDGHLGILQEGAHADLVFYDDTSPPLAPANDLNQQLVFAERGQSVRRVMVVGRTVYDRGHWPTLDVAGARAVAREMRLRRHAR